MNRTPPNATDVNVYCVLLKTQRKNAARGLAHSCKTSIPRQPDPPPTA